MKLSILNMMLQKQRNICGVNPFSSVYDVDHVSNELQVMSVYSSYLLCSELPALSLVSVWLKFLDSSLVKLKVSLLLFLFCLFVWFLTEAWIMFFTDFKVFIVLALLNLITINFRTWELQLVL